VNAVEIESLSTFENGILEKRPILVLAEGRIEDGISKCLSLKIPFSDERAQQTLNREARQFSKAFSNLMVLDLSLIPGGIGAWESLISRRLQPNLNRRIGAILLTRSTLSLNGLSHEERLIMHPAPYLPLPDCFLSRIRQC
jgi:hypothetical protein